MLSKLISLISAIILTLGSFPLVSLAAATDVQLNSATIGITTSGTARTYTTGAADVMESVTVGAASIDLTGAAGSGASLTSTDKMTYTYGSGLSTTFTCNTSNSVVTAGGAGTETFTPTGNTCTTASGGSGGGSGSSGTSIPTTTTTDTTTPTTPTAVVAQATTPAPTPAVPATTPAATVAQPSPVAQLVSPVFNSDLQLGSRGDDVKRLQELLAQDKEIYPDGLATGYFGALTSAAVKKFQAKNGLPQVGRVGPATRAKLNEVFGSAASAAQPSSVAQLVSPVFNSDLQLGSRGDDVKRLQELLAQDKEIYPDGLATGYFGALTSAAVKKFQAKNGLPQVGRVGPATRAKLNEVFGGQGQSSTTPGASVSEDAQRAAMEKQLQDLQNLLNSLLKSQ